MPSIFKSTLIFDFATGDAPGIEIIGRGAGWSESVWLPGQITPETYSAWADVRCSLATNDIRITGWRTTPYEYDNNKLIPKRATVGQLFKSGTLSKIIADPDTALLLKATANNQLSSYPIWIHAIPFEMCKSGAYTPSRPFAANLGRYITFLRTGQGGFVAQWFGRDPTLPSLRVLAVDGVLHTITVAGNLAVANNTDYIRLHRVYSDANQPIKGSFLVTNQVAGVGGAMTYTLAGLPNSTRITPSGTARKDRLAQSVTTSIVASEIADRKVGRPSRLYRGRRSRVR